VANVLLAFHNLLGQPAAAWWTDFSLQDIHPSLFIYRKCDVWS